MRLFEIQKKVRLGDYSIKPTNAQELEAFVKKNCQPWLSQVSDRVGPVYRGFRVKRYRPVNARAFTKRVRKRRNPLHSDRPMHNKFNNAIKKCGLKANRTNSVFVTSDFATAERYGKPYVVMPIGHFNYTWSERVNDWFVNFNNFYNPENPCQYMKGDDGSLEQAILSGHEIMISCEEIVAMEDELYSQLFSITRPNT